MAAISDKRLQHSSDGTAIDYFDADVQSAQEYYAFGAIIKGTAYNAPGNGYRYSFNGKENDNDVKKDADGNNLTGGQQDYGMRIYDPRLGKFLSVDPIAKNYPYYTPYSFAGNKPIWAIDLDGEEEYYYQFTLGKDKQGKSKVGIKFAGEVNNAFIPDFLEPNKYAIRDINGQLLEFEFNTKKELFDFAQGKSLGTIRALSNKELNNNVQNATSAVIGLELSQATGRIEDFAISSDFSAFNSPTESVLGPVAESQFNINKRNGSLFESKVRQELEKTQINVQEQITIKTETSRTRIDFIGIDKETGELVLTEAKASQTAPLTKNQKIAHPEIERKGGKIVGKGKPGYLKGTTIPAKQVNVKRPD